MAELSYEAREELETLARAAGGTAYYGEPRGDGEARGGINLHGETLSFTVKGTNSRPRLVTAEKAFGSVRTFAKHAKKLLPAMAAYRASLADESGLAGFRRYYSDLD